MRIVPSLRAVLLPLALALAFVACRGGEEAAPAAVANEEGPPPISETEADRGRKACRDFQEKVCSLAAEAPAREEECRLAATRIEALDTQLEALSGGGDAEQRRVIQANARRIMKGCLEGLSRLP